MLHDIIASMDLTVSKFTSPGILSAAGWEVALPFEAETFTRCDNENRRSQENALQCGL
jgi:hypothetical protein